MKNEFTAQRVFITGGTSGLGKELALQMLAKGAKVAIIARGQEGLEALQNTAPELKIIQGDVSDKKGIQRIFTEALSHLGSIDLLINNASSLGPTPLRLLLDTECEDFTQVLETNLLGPFRLIKLVLPGMILNQSGLIVNISSDAAVNPYPTWGAYGVSKAALDHLTRIFQAELESVSSVNFLALDPGDMATPLHFAAIPHADPAQLHSPKESAKKIIEILESKNFNPSRRGIYEASNERPKNIL